MHEPAENSFNNQATATALLSLSIVVIGRNEGQRLAKCLQSIRSVHSIAVDEVIYVDSASTDGSPDLASSYGATVIVVHPERPTAAIGRNAGWRRAKSDFVLFLDGDTILHPDFPRIAYNTISQTPSVAAVWGHRREIHPEASLFNRVLDLDWIYAPGFTDFCGGDVLMRRQALVETNGYDERLIAGEEPELCRRMRAKDYKILHIDQPMTGHDLQMTRWNQYWKRATRAGHAYAEISERFRHSADPAWKKERDANFLRGGFWVASLLLALVACFWLGFFPLSGWFALLTLLSARSAWKARWKSKNIVTLLLYGFHSQLQQLPISVGQLQYEWNKRQGKSRGLIEYKQEKAG
jgi:glycosyltransferase involved in cell wall biosynthesis